ncbi:MAG: IS200/IS605 family transposase [Bacteroidetes bacterium]|jgi:putative transposase|nr:IS200/IS605 family transposase [Bacteroidota bacterium]
MANTYSQIYIHVVFAVKGRESSISNKFKDELYKYICGIVTNNHQKVYAINGMPDHLHILISIKPNCLLSDLVRDIKANSSKWINQKKIILGKFQWQEGFGSFSVSESQISKVINYIEKQEEHHRIKSFRQEYVDFLKSYKIDFNEEYLFEWLE